MPAPRSACGLRHIAARTPATPTAARSKPSPLSTGQEDVTEAIAAFLALDDGPAHAIADAWRTAKLAKGLSPAAINRSMAALNLTLFPDGSLELSKYAQHVEEGAAATDPAAS
jgi:hypothetical protein